MITVGLLAKIRRMYYRDGMSLRSISRKTSLSRNTIRHWLRQTDMVEPRYPKRMSESVVDPWAEQLSRWLITDKHRLKRDRRTALKLYQAIKADGYDGSYPPTTTGRALQVLTRNLIVIILKPDQTVSEGPMMRKPKPVLQARRD